MSTEVIMLIVWGAVTAAFLGLLAYNATLTRYEEDQLFLTGNNQRAEEFQSNIVRNVNRTQPILRACGGASAVLGVALLAMYTWQTLAAHPLDPTAEAQSNTG